MSKSVTRAAAVLGVAILPMMQGQAWAQESKSPADEIIITGYRASARASVQTKKQSEVVLDAISQDDIGRLPDLNIVETARRVVGLSTVGGLDPTKSRDIYQRVAIRGLDPKYNLITVDGAPLASSEWTVRGARLEQFPNSLVSRIEAIKTLTAQYDPHGLGGQLNIVSRSAFDARTGRFVAVNGSLGRNSTSGSFLNDRGNNSRVDATAAITFGNHKQFGLTASTEYQKLWSAVLSELPGDTDGSGWTYFTSAGARTPFKSLSRDGVMVPVRPQDFRFDNERTRFSVNTKAEWRLNKTDEVSLFVGYYKDKDEEFRAELLTSPAGIPTNVTDSSGSLPQGNLQQGIVKQPQQRETLLVTGKGSFRLADKIKLDMIASYSNATYDERRIFQKWASSVTPGRAAGTNLANFGYTYTIAGGSPLATHLAPTLGADPANYVNLYVRDVTRDSDSHVAFAKAELGFNADKTDRGFGARVGASFTRTLQKFGVGYLELTPANATAQTQVGGLTRFIFPKTYTSRDHAVLQYFVIDPDKVNAYVAANQGLFVATDQRANNFADDFRDLEDVKAAYAQALFRNEKLFVVGGLRYDATDVNARTFQVPTVAAATDYERVSRDASYHFLLPSVLATYSFTPDVRVSVGASKTIGRPDFVQYAARTTYSIGSVPGTLTINTGNPALKPREAANYDLSVEWYLRNGGLFSVAAFKKDLSNEIFTGTQQGPTTTYLGVSYPNVTISTPLNAAKGEVTGLEFSYAQDTFTALPDWLQGLGVNANLTILNGSFELPVSTAGVAAGQGPTRTTNGLIQQPDYVANATLFYERGPFEARASYNKIGRALQAANQDTAERDLYQEPREQIDLQLRYTLRPSLQLIVQGQNVTEEPFIVRQGPGRVYLNNKFPVGSVFWIGFSWKPAL